MKLWRHRSGQATVEMAIVAPILILLLIGVVEIARLATTQLAIEHTVRETVRLGITGATDSQLVSRAQTVAGALDPSRLTVTISPSGSRTSGQDVTVSVSYPYQVMVLSRFLGAQVQLQAQLTARVE